VSSIEAKALETAQIVASHLNLIMSPAEGLHEHDRSNLEWVNQWVFEQKVAEFFRYPQTLVLGNETAVQAYERFAAGVDRSVEKYPGKNTVIITHGTVMTLYMAQFFKINAFGFWKRLGLPSFVVLDFPDMRLGKVKFIV